MQSPKIIAASLLLLLQATQVFAFDETSLPFDDGAVMTLHYPDWFKESFLVLPDDAAEAEADGKRGLLLFFTTQGCAYCHLFIQEVLGNADLSGRLREHFDSIGFEIFSDAELTAFDGEQVRVKEFALDQGVEFAPTLLFVNTAGNRLLRLTGYYGPDRFSQVLDYLTTNSGGELSWREYLATQHEEGKSSSRTLREDPMFAQPPFALDRTQVRSERPLLVFFETADCNRCERFHDEVLSDAATRERLADFDVFRFDADDTTTPVMTPDGQRTTPSEWYRSFAFTQLPALVFFSEAGEPVLETDAMVLSNRMSNAIGFVTDRAYEQGWNYQRYARTESIKRLNQ
jgi:thioredoxin-related protein